jgi:tetratricopeptide (TPR) repeat protein
MLTPQMRCAVKTLAWMLHNWLILPVCFYLFFLSLAHASPASSGSPAPSPSSRPTPSREALKIVAKAIRTQTKGDLEEAKKLYLQAREKDPHLRGVDYQLAVIAFKQKHEDEARRHIAASIKLDEEIANCHTLLGVMLANSGKLEEACSEFEKAIDAQPDDPQPYYDLSETYRREGKPAEAIPPLRAAVQRKPAEPLFALKLRLAEIETGKTDALRKEAAEELKLTPPTSDWLITAAALAISEGNVPQGAKYMEQAQKGMDQGLFLAILQDPFFTRHKSDPGFAKFYDYKIEPLKR